MADETNTTTTTETNASAAEETNASAAKTSGAQQNEQTENKGLTVDEIKKLVQSSTDRATAELGKKIAALQKENAELKKKDMTAEQVKQFEIDEREKTIADKEKDLLDRENRLFALGAIKEIGLDDGSKLAMSLVDFVMADEQDKITERVKAFNDLVQGFVSAKVDEKFKAIGRTPNGAAAQNTDTKKDASIAETLGKRRAEQAKKSNDVLNMYLGGKK